MTGITHRVAEERSLALHEEVVRRLRARPELLEQARRRVKRWADDGSVSRRYVSAWRDLLSQPLDRIVAVLLDPGERAAALRQTSPFAGVIDSATRWRILRDHEAERRRSREP